MGWIPFTSQSRKIVANSIKYFGYTYKLFGIKNRPLPDVVKGGQFAEDSKGRWYVCLQVEVQPDNNHGNKEIGVDLGLKTLVTTSDGEKYANPSYFRKSEQKLKVAQRANNKKQVRNIHAKIKNQRKDYNHKLSNKLIGESSLIIVGNVKATFGQKGLRKAGLDASWSGLREMLRYKASRHGVKYLEVNESFTTQTCSHCGQRPDGRPKGIAGLGIREWTCSLCGETHDRDVNAAKNILILGRGAAPPVEGSLAVKANSNRISTNLYGMKLSARPLIDIDDVNDFRYSTQLEFHYGDATTFYFQLVDQDKNTAQQGFYPSGLRYCPIAAATLQVTFINISDSKQFIRFASQPFANDTSIWSVPLLATDPLEGTISIKCVLSENTGTEEAPVTRTRTFNLPASILVAV